MKNRYQNDVQRACDVEHDAIANVMNDLLIEFSRRRGQVDASWGEHATLAKAQNDLEEMRDWLKNEGECAR